MRHTVLCLIVALLAAVACFVLLPVLGLLLLRIFAPGLFQDDTLGWALIFGGPALLALLSIITIIVGVVAFFVSRAKLPDLGWRSTLGSSSWPWNTDAEKGEFTATYPRFMLQDAMI